MTMRLENHRRSMVCSRGEERGAITNDLASDMIAAIQFLLHERPRGELI